MATDATTIAAGLPEPEFKPFMRLPLEIRILIWEYAYHTFIHVVWPDIDPGLEANVYWLLLHGGIRKPCRGPQDFERKGYRIYNPFRRGRPQSTYPIRTPPAWDWMPKFDSRLLACHESAHVAKRQFAAEKAAEQPPEISFLSCSGMYLNVGYWRGTRHNPGCWHFGDFSLDLVYFANTKGWDRFVSKAKGVPDQASVLFTLASTFEHNPYITRFAVRTPPAALDSLDVGPSDTMFQSDGVTVVPAKDRLADSLREWKSPRELWIVVDLPVERSWLMIYSPPGETQVKKKKKRGKKKQTGFSILQLRRDLVSDMRCEMASMWVSGERGFVHYDDAYSYALKWFRGKAKGAGIQDTSDTSQMAEQKAKVGRALGVLREVFDSTHGSSVPRVNIRAVVDVTRGFGGV